MVERRLAFQFFFFFKFCAAGMFAAFDKADEALAFTLSLTTD